MSEIHRRFPIECDSDLCIHQDKCNLHFNGDGTFTPEIRIVGEPAEVECLSDEEEL